MHVRHEAGVYEKTWRFTMPTRELPQFANVLCCFATFCIAKSWTNFFSNMFVFLRHRILEFFFPTVFFLWFSWELRVSEQGWYWKAEMHQRNGVCMCEEFEEACWCWSAALFSLNWISKRLIRALANFKCRIASCIHKSLPAYIFLVLLLSNSKKSPCSCFKPLHFLFLNSKNPCDLSWALEPTAEG